MYKRNTFGYLALHSGVASGLMEIKIKDYLLIVKMKSDEGKKENPGQVPHRSSK